MLNPQEATLDLKKYFKKLLAVIEREAKFTLIKVKIDDKKGIDDIFCCIDASWPENYKAYIAKYSSGRLKTPAQYNKLKSAIKNKFALSTDCYAVRHKEVSIIINTLTTAIEQDMNFIYSDQSGMF